MAEIINTRLIITYNYYVSLNIMSLICDKEIETCKNVNSSIKSLIGWYLNVIFWNAEHLKKFWHTTIKIGDYTGMYKLISDQLVQEDEE